MRTAFYTTNLRAKQVQLTGQDRLQIALALHTLAARDALAAKCQELSEEKLTQWAAALHPVYERGLALYCWTASVSRRAGSLSELMEGNRG